MYPTSEWKYELSIYCSLMERFNLLILHLKKVCFGTVLSVSELFNFPESTFIDLFEIAYRILQFKPMHFVCT